MFTATNNFTVNFTLQRSVAVGWATGRAPTNALFKTTKRRILTQRSRKVDQQKSIAVIKNYYNDYNYS